MLQIDAAIAVHGDRSRAIANDLQMRRPASFSMHVSGILVVAARILVVAVRILVVAVVVLVRHTEFRPPHQGSVRGRQADLVGRQQPPNLTLSRIIGRMLPRAEPEHSGLGVTRPNRSPWSPRCPACRALARTIVGVGAPKRLCPDPGLPVQYRNQPLRPFPRFFLVWFARFPRSPARGALAVAGSVALARRDHPRGHLSWAAWQPHLDRPHGRRRPRCARCRRPQRLDAVPIRRVLRSLRPTRIRDLVQLARTRPYAPAVHPHRRRSIVPRLPWPTMSHI